MKKQLTAAQQRNIFLFNETHTAIKESEYLREHRDLSIRTQHVILETDGEIPHTPRFNEPAKVVVSGKGSFDAARAYRGSVCVLNFASATTPGGGVKTGASAQEEILCRDSTLYWCLSDERMVGQFYAPHTKHCTPLHNDDIIYTQGVAIIRDEDGKIGHPCDWRLVDVISCAAPNLRKKPANRYNKEQGPTVQITDEELLALHEKRARRIMSVAAEIAYADHIILGAFGCGAFRNNPRIVAQAYKNVIPEFLDSFRTIEFAVKCGKDKTNFTVFNEILSPQPGETEDEH